MITLNGANAMSQQQDFVDRREHKRFTVKPAPLPVNEGKIGRIIDIGMGGFSFRYIGEEGSWSNKLFDLGLLFDGVDLETEKLRLKTASDVEIPGSFISSRRRCVKFADLTPKQISKLENFIANYTMGEVEIPLV